MVLDDDIAEIDIGRRERQILVQEIGREHVPGIIFVGDAQIVGLRAIFRPERELAAEQIGAGAFELGGIAVVAVAAESQDAELIGFGFSAASRRRAGFRAGIRSFVAAT